MNAPQSCVYTTLPVSYFLNVSFDVRTKQGDLILRVLDYIVTISVGYIFYCVCFNLYCGGFILFCNVWLCVCEGFVMCVRVCVCVCVCARARAHV